MWYMFFLRKGTRLTGASWVLWQNKVLKPLMVRAEAYISSRRSEYPVILVPLANPETEKSLLKLSTTLAKSRKARLRLIHIVDVPVQTPLEAGRLEYEEQRKEKETLLELASRHASENGVRAVANAIVAHNIPSAILSAADMESPELIIMGWKGSGKIPRSRRTNVGQVLKIAKGNVLVLKDRGIENVKKILVPMGGGPHAFLGLKMAQELAQQWGSSLTALRVQKGKGISESSSEFYRQSVDLFQSEIEDFTKRTLEKADILAEVRVMTGTDISRTIVETSADYDLIVMGASNEWALRQWLFGSIPDQVVDNSPISVLMVRAHQDNPTGR